MKTADFDYDLPRRFIAQHPPRRRDASRLLVLHRNTGEMEHRAFSDLPEHLGAGDALVLNDTRVLRARLHGRRETGGAVEVLLVRPAREALPAAEGEQPWEAMARSRGRLREGEVLGFSDGLSGRVLGRRADGVLLLGMRCAGALEAALERIGRAPLPPYIKRPRDADPFAAEDAERYQTVYAARPGAVAAPTAGLHFTRELLARAERAGCTVVRLTLHVGPGTFKPVTAGEVESHHVDAEHYVVRAGVADAVNRAGRVVAVGTTTCRALETVAGEGAPRVRGSEGWTDLFIHPPYRFRAVDALVTNFHLPRSSLLMLVSAFAGRELILAAYEEAKARGYRFYSYGDAMLIL